MSKLKILLNIVLFLIVAGWLYFEFVYKKPSFNEGELAQNFAGTFYKGDSFELEDYRGQYVVLDFWGSWCGPCRNERHKVVRLYRDFSDKEFLDASSMTMISIGIEKSTTRWEKARKSEMMDWKTQYTTASYFSDPAAKIFNVREIPTKVLIGAKGEVLFYAKSTDEIRAHLQSKLK